MLHENLQHIAVSFCTTTLRLTLNTAVHWQAPNTDRAPPRTSCAACDDFEQNCHGRCRPGSPLRAEVSWVAPICSKRQMLHLNNRESLTPTPPNITRLCVSTPRAPTGALADENAHLSHNTHRILITDMRTELNIKVTNRKLLIRHFATSRGESNQALWCNCH